MASSTTKPVEIVSAHERQVVQAVAEQIHHAEGADQRQRNRNAGKIVAATVRKKRKITSTTKATVSINSNCTSSTEARMVVVRSVSTETLIDDGSEALSCGINFSTRSTTPMMFCAGLPFECEDHGWRVVHPRGLLDGSPRHQSRRPRRRVAPARRCGRR